MKLGDVMNDNDFLWMLGMGGFFIFYFVGETFVAIMCAMVSVIVGYSDYERHKRSYYPRNTNSEGILWKKKV